MLFECFFFSLQLIKNCNLINLNIIYLTIMHVYGLDFVMNLCYAKV